MPEISIILPTYNGSRFIRQSIESCLAQTFVDFELIIVNDCSTDNTLDILNEYAEKDSRIKIVNNIINLKLPLSLNAGFEIAKGQYHTWTSDDNYYAPNALETLCNKLKADNQIDFIYTDYTLIDDKNNVIGEKRFNNINDSFTKWIGCGACFLYKSQIFKTVKGYSPAAFLIEDYDFFMRAYLDFQFYYYPSTNLYYYREHDSSLTAQHGKTVNLIAKIMIERQMSRLEKKLPKNDLALLYRKFAIFNATQVYQLTKSARYLQKLYALSPRQAFISVIYIIVMKTLQLIEASFKMIVIFAKCIFTSGTAKKDGFK